MSKMIKVEINKDLLKSRYSIDYPKDLDEVDGAAEITIEDEKTGELLLVVRREDND